MTDAGFSRGGEAVILTWLGSKKVTAQHCLKEVAASSSAGKNKAAALLQVDGNF